jgi:hypothetical protein
MAKPHFLLVMVILLFAVVVYSQEERYFHPVYEISFEATPNWTEYFPDTNDKGYSLVNPNNNMVISLAYVPGVKRPKKYMKSLSGFKGLVSPRGGYDTILNDQEALILCGNCLESRESFSTMVIGFPTQDGLYIMEISCPENCQAVHRQRLQNILNTVRVGKTSAI